MPSSRRLGFAAMLLVLPLLGCDDDDLTTSNNVLIRFENTSSQTVLVTLYSEFVNDYQLNLTSGETLARDVPGEAGFAIEIDARADDLHATVECVPGAIMVTPGTTYGEVRFAIIDDELVIQCNAAWDDDSDLSRH
jgi:hypothetical protein